MFNIDSSTVHTKEDILSIFQKKQPNNLNKNSFDTLTTSSNTMFQFCKSPIVANWLVGSDIEAYKMANKVSADINHFYTPFPGSLFNVYSSLIHSLYVDPEKEENATTTQILNRILKQVKLALVDANNQSIYFQPDGQFVKLPTITISGNLGEDIASWERYGRDEYDFDLRLNDRNSDRFSIRMTFKGFKSYSITFGEWFSPVFGSPEIIGNSISSAIDKKVFFDKVRGSFHLIPSLIWVVYQPKMELVIKDGNYSHTLYNNLIDTIEEIAGGIVSFDDLQKTNIKGNEISITYGNSYQNKPMLFGVTSIKNYLEN